MAIIYLKLATRHWYIESTEAGDFGISPAARLLNVLFPWEAGPTATAPQKIPWLANGLGSGLTPTKDTALSILVAARVRAAANQIAAILVHSPGAHDAMDKGPQLLPAYTGSCNPPRRAKRLRTDSLSQPAASSSASAQQHKILPKPSASVDLDSDAGESDSTTPPPPPRRRGRKPGVLSRSARESLRKENHSRIEKARRTKINDALATLRELVPATYPREVEEGKVKTKRDEKQKEFKLEVLVRTVAYMQDLIAKVKIFEDGQCPSCGGDRKAPAAAVDTGAKRKRPVEDEEPYEPETEEDELHSDGEGEEPAASRPKPQAKQRVENKPQGTSPEPISATPTMLPSISSWLPKPYMDPSYIALSTSTSTSPQIHPHVPALQLPSPPSSTQFRPTASTQLPPSLALPSPHATPLLTSAFSPPPRRRAESLSLPQAWTVDDESAASMLLRISSSSSSSSDDANAGVIARAGREEVGIQDGQGVSHEQKAFMPFYYVLSMEHDGKGGEKVLSLRCSCMDAGSRLSPMQAASDWPASESTYIEVQFDSWNGFIALTKF
ncbi:hypothetical protein GLOTRDRAFT_96064 [Gloeophyllum trabeum ATCC 11539]|uniref:BHLH domain-containing protein n=1 Tax=Gloeophyllum trabeum (strain ATCC 11539 / FP-39264 / Madison 617) TaxID=670483 RepID=S7PVY5_GLOTA|nr:uncharacterized protein GLOTRDRAFT_96064 [Gloeophyllum trabeum ATCC 11539]EPQ51801.1 hypothetical protein GLOTRDRAFT_96064 [Gloeophyllum trabeum ATCC 11539]